MNKPLNKKVIRCRNCDGKGEKFDHLPCVFTFGIGYLAGFKDRCRLCKGKGYVELGENVELVEEE